MLCHTPSHVRHKLAGKSIANNTSCRLSVSVNLSFWCSTCKSTSKYRNTSTSSVSKHFSIQLLLLLLLLSSSSLDEVNILAGRQELLLSAVNRCKISWFSHVCCHDTLPKRPRKSWKHNIKEWTCRSMSSLLRIADDSHRSGCICRSVRRS